MHNEKGYAMLVSILSIVFISIIGISLFSITTVTHSQSTHERKDQSIFYIAEAGVNIKEARIKKLIEQAYEESKVDEENFEANFNSKLQNIINSEAYSVYDNSIFQSNYNGNPKAIVTIVKDPSNIRAFKIVSKGLIVGTSKERTVEKSYTIPGTLITKTTIQQPVLNPGTPPSTPLPGPTVDDFVISGTANNYVSDRLEIHAIHKNNLNMKTYTNFDRKTSTTLLSFDWINKNSDNISFNKSYVNKNPITIPHKTLNYSTSTNGYLSLTSNLQKLTNNVEMPDLRNFKNFVFNIETDDNITIYFPKERTRYNLNSIRFNVKGTGTVNLVFKESFQLDAGTKFVVNTKDSSAKVNIIFENYAHIFGELQAQDIYFPNTINNFEVHTNGKLIANDIFVNNGNINKQAGGNLKANNISIKKGNLDVMTNGAVLANHVQVMDGTFHISGASGKFISKSLSILNGNLEAMGGTCIRSKDIFVKNGRINSASTLVYENLSVKTYSSYADANVNKNFSKCSTPTIVIIPPTDIPVQEYIDVNQYTYETTYLHSHPLIEVD